MRELGKRVGAEVARRIAARYGAGLLVADVPYAGWVLFGLAVAFEVGACILLPSEKQKWAAGTWFGIEGKGKKFESPAEEETELMNLFNPPPEPPKPYVSPPLMIFPFVIPGDEMPSGEVMA